MLFSSTTIKTACYQLDGTTITPPGKWCPLDYSQPNILQMELGNLPLFELLILSCILLKSYCLQNWAEESFDFVCN